MISLDYSKKTIEQLDKLIKKMDEEANFFLNQAEEKCMLSFALTIVKNQRIAKNQKIQTEKKQQKTFYLN